MTRKVKSFAVVIDNHNHGGLIAGLGSAFAEHLGKIGHSDINQHRVAADGARSVPARGGVFVGIGCKEEHLCIAGEFVLIERTILIAGAGCVCFGEQLHLTGIQRKSYAVSQRFCLVTKGLIPKARCHRERCEHCYYYVIFSDHSFLLD